MSILHYQEAGPRSGPAVVLIHSLATSSEIWVHQVPVWSLNFRVVCIDLPGHGRSPVSEDAVTLADMAEKVMAVLDHLEIAKAAFVGISLGGMVTQAVALNHPHRVSAMVVAHAGARTEAAVREIWDQRIEQFEAGGMENLAQATLERWFPRSFSESSPMTMDWMSSLIEATDPRGYVMAIRAIQQLDHLDRLPNVKTPTLVVAGRADAAVPPTVAALVAENMPNAQLRLLEETGHIGSVQQPVVFTETVGRFLLSTLGVEGTQSANEMETLK